MANDCNRRRLTMFARFARLLVSARVVRVGLWRLRRFGMGRVKLHLVRYMGTYTALMFVSFLLWQAAGCPAGALSAGASAWDAPFAAGTATAGNPLALASDFLIEFSLVAYPLYCAIKGFCKRISGRKGGLRREQRALYHDAPSVSAH